MFKFTDVTASHVYEIPNNDLVDDMKLWPPFSYLEVYC